MTTQDVRYAPGLECYHVTLNHRGRRDVATWYSVEQFSCICPRLTAASMTCYLCACQAQGPLSLPPMCHKVVHLGR